MDPSAWFTLAVTLIAAALLISDKLRPDLIALLVMITLGLSGVVSQQETFVGFGGPAVMTILGISIISEALHQTGVTLFFSRVMQRLGQGSETRLLLVTTVSAALLSLVMNNVATVGVLLPAVMTLSRQSRTPPHRLLIPLAYGTIMGGMATLLTTANIIVSGTLRDAGYRPYGLLDFVTVGAPVVVVGTLFILTIGRRLLPPTEAQTKSSKKAQHLGTRLATLYEINKQLNLIEVLPDSPLADKTLAQGEWATQTGLIVVGLIRHGQTQLAPRGNDLIQAGDVVVVHGQPDEQKLADLRLRSNGLSSGLPVVMDETVVLAELVIAPHSSLIGRTLRTENFREKYNVNVLAIWRNGKPIHTGIADIPLEFGDALLVQGPAGRIHLLHDEPELILLEEDPDAVLKPNKAKWTILISVLALAVAATGLIPVAYAMVGGAVLLLLINTVSMNEAYRSIEWRVIFLIAGMWPLSIALRTTGLADFAANTLLTWVGTHSGLVVAALLLLVSMVLTQFMSGQVAALVLAPLALVAAEQIGVDPRALGVAVAIGCSLAFITPLGHPVNIMVMGPGGYTTRDFLRIGTPLTVIAIAVILAGLYLFWGLH